MAFEKERRKEVLHDGKLPCVNECMSWSIIVWSSSMRECCV